METILLAAAIGLVIGMAICVSAGVHGYVKAIKEHAHKYHEGDCSDDR